MTFQATRPQCGSFDLSKKSMYTVQNWIESSTIWPQTQLNSHILHLSLTATSASQSEHRLEIAHRSPTCSPEPRPDTTNPAHGKD